MILAMEKVAKKLKTSPIWVETCMRSYGRPIPRSVSIDPELREEFLERMEEVDLAPEDTAPEDLAEPDVIIPEPDTAGVSKRKANEHSIRRLPVR